MHIFDQSSEKWTQEQFDVFEKESLAWLDQQQQKLIDEFYIGQYERFDVNFQTAELTFSDAKVPKIVAKIQFVGTLAVKSESWLWSWDNKSTPTNLSQELLQVKQFGEEHTIYPLFNPRYNDVNDTFCYSVTAVAARLLDAKGVYRCPSSNGYTYLIFMDMQWA